MQVHRVVVQSGRSGGPKPVSGDANVVIESVEILEVGSRLGSAGGSAHRISRLGAGSAWGLGFGSRLGRLR